MPARGPIDLAGCHDLVVVKPSSLGDVVHTLPAVHALKRAFPALRLHWVVNNEWAALLDGNPDLASVIVFPRRELRGLRAAPGFVRWCRSARAVAPGGFDVAADFQGLLRSVLIARGLGARALAGLSDAREGARWFYRQRAGVGGILHAVDRYLALAAALGGDSADPCFPLPSGEAVAGVAPDDLARAVVVHPYSRGAGKSLPDDLAVGLAAGLAPRRVVVVGTRPSPPPHWTDNVLDLANQTNLAHLLWLIRGAATTISVDSGPMHLAAALPRPLLGLHTWSDPRKVGPWRGDAHVWKAGRVVRVADLPAQPEKWCAAQGAWDALLPGQAAAWLDAAAGAAAPGGDQRPLPRTGNVR